MGDSEQSSSDVFNMETIRRLVELMKEHDLSEVDLRSSDQQIRLCRGSGQLTTFHSAPPAPAPAAPAAAPVSREEENPNIVLIKSPMVGTFYSRPNPNAPPFVKVGDHVETDSTVCIIEAMKVFNEIPAEVRGTVVAVLVDDEEPVEFGRPLYRVDTSK